MRSPVSGLLLLSWLWLARSQNESDTNTTWPPWVAPSLAPTPTIPSDQIRMTLVAVTSQGLSLAGPPWFGADPFGKVTLAYSVEVGSAHPLWAASPRFDCLVDGRSLSAVAGALVSASGSASVVQVTCTIPSRRTLAKHYCVDPAWLSSSSPWILAEDASHAVVLVAGWQQEEWRSAPSGLTSLALPSFDESVAPCRVVSREPGVSASALSVGHGFGLACDDSWRNPYSSVLLFTAVKDGFPLSSTLVADLAEVAGTGAQGTSSIDVIAMDELHSGVWCAHLSHAWNATTTVTGVNLTVAELANDLELAFTLAPLMDAEVSNLVLQSIVNQSLSAQLTLAHLDEQLTTVAELTGSNPVWPATLDAMYADYFAQRVADFSRESAKVTTVAYAGVNPSEADIATLLAECLFHCQVWAHAQDVSSVALMADASDEYGARAMH